MKRFLSMAVFAGLLIGTGGLVYLRVGGIPGAVLFAFGIFYFCKARKKAANA